MVGKQLENESRKDLVQSVTSVGNSWVLCRSKSYSGRVYYFNTLTGEAAWNLSEAEVEKAKHRTKDLESRPGVHIEGCPEPTEPPMDHSNEADFQNRLSSNTQPPSRIYNKQIINNQFPKQQYAAFAPFAAQTCSHVVPPLSMSVANPTFSPNIWAIPPNHQFFIAPTISPLVNQSQATVGIAFGNQNHNLPVQVTSQPLSTRFQALHDIPQGTSPKKYFQRHFKQRGRSFGFRNFQSRFSRTNYPKNVENDLRQLLSAKRNSRQPLSAKRNSKDEINIKNKSPEVHMNQESCSHTTTKSINLNKDDLINTDGDWLEENTHVNGTKLNLDVTNLKNLANENANTDCWYITADKDILLNHLNFLNILFHSDEKCQLMVPQEVVAELKGVVEAGNGSLRDINRAQRAVNFLSQQLDAGCAIIGDGSSDCNDFGDAYILNSCLDLAEQNYHVVLLSNNNSLREYKNSTGIYVFSMNEIKQFLTFKEPKPQNPISASSANAIKIIIPNDLLRTTEGNTSSNNFKKDTKSRVEKLSHEKSDIVKSKLSLDASVQTDSSQVQSEKTDVKSVTSNEPQIDLRKNADGLSNNNLTISDKSDDSTGNITLKRKEIRLKRSTSNQTSVTSETSVDKKDVPTQPSVTNENSVDKKQFKWRRQRNMRSNKTNGLKQSSTNNSDCIDNIEKSVPSEINNMSAPNSVEPHHQSTESINKLNEVFREDLDSSETGSYIVQRNISERIIIEETSTSGIISNTSIESDTESAKMRNLKVNFSINKKPESSHINMFEVTDKLMEDYLKMRCDEWVSRFVQIMEEVLTQVLELDPPFQHSIMRPPWTLNEATECIKIKFNENHEIQSSANKLNDALIRTSDNRDNGLDSADQLKFLRKRGERFLLHRIRKKKDRNKPRIEEINIDMTPQEFMEIYSYGVHLVDRLEYAFQNCEDLHTASESLSKLLSDIQNPQLDTIHNDTFGDVHDSAGNITQIQNITNEKLTPKKTRTKLSKEQDLNVITPEKNETKLSKEHELNIITPKKNATKLSKEQEVNVNDNVNIESYNLRSMKRKMNQDNQQKIQSVKFIRNIDIKADFFKSLNLQKTVNMAVTHNDDNNIKGCISQEPVKISKSQIDESDNKSHTEPKIVRNFIKFQEFEKRLGYISPSDLDQFNCTDDEFFSEHNSESEEEFKDDAYENAPDNDSNKTESPKHDNEVTSNCYWIFRKELQSIKVALLQVNLFCEETRKELCSSQISNSRKIEIHNKAEVAYLHIKNLCQCLNRIIDRETIDSVNNTQSVLKKEGINDFEGVQFHLYRAIISRCEEQANILLECVDFILTAVKNVST